MDVGFSDPMACESERSCRCAEMPDRTGVNRINRWRWTAWGGSIRAHDNGVSWSNVFLFTSLYTISIMSCFRLVDRDQEIPRQRERRSSHSTDKTLVGAFALNKGDVTEKPSIEVADEEEMEKRLK